MYSWRSSYHEASLVPSVVAARRDEGIPDVEVQRGLIHLDREAIEMTADSAREGLGAQPLHALRDGVQVDLRRVEHGRQAEPVGDPQDVTPALRHGRLGPRADQERVARTEVEDVPRRHERGGDIGNPAQRSGPE